MYPGRRVHLRPIVGPRGLPELNRLTVPASSTPRPPQWKEMVKDSTGRITRPRQIYTGELRRKFVPVYERQLSGHIDGERGCAVLCCEAGWLWGWACAVASPVVAACMDPGCLLLLGVVRIPPVSGLQLQAAA